ncbi:Asparagine synthetase domain-containing protein [Schistosoma japonicum]|uniref:Asparagine synthetase domain-containing protein n=1 Tax=Schistosoma japonicum TaxID=6182 RepID=A0A4Z2DWS8_SCHJA|nr:Asparagine synthetase domain-containing protein [Schistosoma japonicum]
MPSFGLFVSVTPATPEICTQVEDFNSIEFQSVLDGNSAFYHTLERSCWKIAKVSGGYVAIFYSSSVFSDQLSVESHQFLVQSNPGSDILFWSGQIYSSSEITLARKIKSENANVGQVLLDAFSKEKEVAGVVNLINSLVGSFILIFVNIKSSRIYFTRDRCGRHSVVARRFIKAPDDSLCIDSISSMVIQTQPSFPEVTLELLEKNAKDWFEIPACGIFVSKIVCDSENIFLSDVNLYPWSEQHLSLCPSSLSAFVNRVLDKHQNCCSRVLPNVYTSITFKEAQHKLLELLLTVVCDSVNNDLLFNLNYSFNLINVADNNWSGSLFGLLFSGGLDSSVIAVILDRFVPKNQSIDLINVGFQRKCSDASVSSSTCLDDINLISAEEAPDRITALRSYEELCKLSPQRKWNFIKVNVSVSEIQEARIKHVWPLLLPEHTTVLDDSLGLALWFAARGEGVLHSSSDLEVKCISSVKFLFLGSGIDEQLAGYARHLTIYK